MSTTLKIIGIILIFCGIIASILILSSVDWGKYSITQKVANDLLDNPYAQNMLTTEQTVVFFRALLAIISFVSGVISGVLFFALAKIIDSLTALEFYMSKQDKGNNTLLTGDVL